LFRRAGGLWDSGAVLEGRAWRGGIAAGRAAAGKGFFLAGITAGWAANRGEETAAVRAGFGVTLDFVAAVIAKKTGLFTHDLCGLGTVDSVIPGRGAVTDGSGGRVCRF